MTHGAPRTSIVVVGNRRILSLESSDICNCLFWYFVPWLPASIAPRVNCKRSYDTQGNCMVWRDHGRGLRRTRSSVAERSVSTRIAGAFSSETSCLVHHVRRFAAAPLRGQLRRQGRLAKRESIFLVASAGAINHGCLWLVSADLFKAALNAKTASFLRNC